MITVVLFAALAIPRQQVTTSPETNAPVAPEQVLAWQLEGLTQEEIREEVTRHGLTQCADDRLLNALSSARADAETIRVVKQAKAPCKIWKLGLRLPGPTDYLYEMAGAISRGDRETALQTMQDEVGNQPRNPDVRLIYAYLLRSSEDWIMAYGETTEAVALSPQSPYAHALRSTVCYHSRLPECALREAMVFVKLRGEDARAYIVLGNAREIQGQDGEALRAYMEAKQLHAGYAEIYAGLGRVYERGGQFEKAVGAFDEAIRLDGNEAEYYGELAQVYQAEGYMRRAIKNWKKAKELEPERAELLLALANAYLAAEHYTEAIREYRELLEKAPELDSVRPQLAKALRAEEADKVYREPEELNLTKEQ